MFQYEFEKPRKSEWSRSYPNGDGNSRAWPSGSEASRSPPASEVGTISHHSRRALPLPPRPPVMCSTRIHTTKPTVPLKVWVIASASCFAVCAALVLATVMITKWGATGDYQPQEYYREQPVGAQVYAQPKPLHSSPVRPQKTTPEPDPITSTEVENDIQYPILEKLAIFKNMVAKKRKPETQNKKTQEVFTEKKKSEEVSTENIKELSTEENLTSKKQIHPLHDTIEHKERNIQKKDQAKHPIPEFKPTLPDVFINERQIKLPEQFEVNAKHSDYYEDEYYYNDENLYNDYLQSNTMTSYLLEKVQELHDWITSDSDFEIVHNTTSKFKKHSRNDFAQLLKALNESLVEGNVTIVMNKLKDIYFGDNYTNANHSRKVILSNSTDLLSFGILSLDVMLLRNIQLMAWENQESVRAKMLKDPDVFAFNALFLEPSKVEARRNEIYSHADTNVHAKRQSLREMDDFDIGKTLIENVLEVGMSTARAAIHLGRAYRNTKLVLSQLSNRDNLNTNIQKQISRNIDSNTHALNHLQTSYSKNESVANNSPEYTELDCVWMLYCKNLVATAKLNAPYGVMARINGMALRMLTGELSADRALGAMLHEAVTGWTELRCADMFPRCSKVNAASVVLESIIQPLRRSQAQASSNRAR